jgi:hypothetical protein
MPQKLKKKQINIALLLLRLGGPCLLGVLSKALNIPGISTVYWHAE